MASKEEVRAWARKSANGEKLADHERAAVNRTTSQAGSEGKKVTRLLGGSKEKDD